MDQLIIILIILFAVSVMSFILGWLLARTVISLKNKKIMKNLNEVLEGKRENYIEIDGVKYPAEKFRLRDKEGREALVDLKGGKVEQTEENANQIKDQNRQEREETVRESPPNSRENSRSSGKKKRIVRTRNGRRIRRFG